MKLNYSHFCSQLNSINPRIIYLCIALAVIIPTILRLPLAIVISSKPRQFFQTIDQMPPNSIVLMSFDYTPSTEMELTLMAEAILRHVFCKNLNLVVISLHPEGLAIARQVLQKIIKEFPDKEYGYDYLNLGFKEGEEVVLANMGEKISNAFPYDHEGRDVENFELMKRIENFKQIDLIIDLSTGKPGLKEWITLVQSAYKVRLAGGVTAVHAVEYEPYLQSKQLVAMLAGYTDGAEYDMLVNELLNRNVSEAAISLSAQSLAHLVMVFLIILGNVGYLLNRINHRKK